MKTPTPLHSLDEWLDNHPDADAADVHRTLDGLLQTATLLRNSPDNLDARLQGRREALRRDEPGTLRDMSPAFTVFEYLRGQCSDYEAPDCRDRWLEAVQAYLGARIDDDERRIDECLDVLASIQGDTIDDRLTTAAGRSDSDPRNVENPSRR